MSLVKHPERRLDPPDSPYEDCPDCDGVGHMPDMESMACQRCDGEGYIDVKREAREEREEMAERVAEDDFNRV